MPNDKTTIRKQRLPFTETIDSKDLFQISRNVTGNKLFARVASFLNWLLGQGVFTVWTGNYVNGQEYVKGEQTLDEGWLGIANKTTIDRPEPQPLGNPFYLMNDAVFLTQQNTSIVYSGQIYNFVENGWITKVRVFAPEVIAGAKYRVIIVNLANPSDPSFDFIADPILNDNDWTIVFGVPTLVLAGDRIGIFLDALNSSANTIKTGDWRYDGRDNNNPPLDEGWNSSNNRTVVRIDKDDLTSTDRTADLDSIITDSVLRFEDKVTPAIFEEYLVVGEHIDFGTFFEYPVIQTDSGGTMVVGNTSTLTATIPIPDTTKFVEEVDFWLTNQPSYAIVSGYLQFNDTVQSVPDNGYGVDIEFQRAEMSPDWDIQSFSEELSPIGDNIGTDPLELIDIDMIGGAIAIKVMDEEVIIELLESVTYSLPQIINVIDKNFLINIKNISGGTAFVERSGSTDLIEDQIKQVVRNGENMKLYITLNQYRIL